MAIRFQRRISIVPGVRLNVSKSGLGLSVGPRGASISVGPRGTYANAGLPGTGLSIRSKMSSSSTNRRASSSPLQVAASIKVTEDGTVRFLMADGRDAPPAVVKRTRSQHVDIIEDVIKEFVDLSNADLHACLSIHKGTPSPDYEPLTVLDTPPKMPVEPQSEVISFWAKFFGKRASIEARNARAKQAFDSQLNEWSKSLKGYTQLIKDVDALNMAVQLGEAGAQENRIANSLSNVAWAKETHVSFDFGSDSATLELDIDLPEIEDIPDSEANVPTRGLNIRWKKRGVTQKKKDFSYLAHATLFRVAGEVFASLPKVHQVTISGYTQRHDPATGHVKDVYVLSTRINRYDWREIDFQNLESINVESALEQFELVRNQLKSGEMREIVPLK
jgi:hypothetical protein